MELLNFVTLLKKILLLALLIIGIDLYSQEADKETGNEEIIIRIEKNAKGETLSIDTVKSHEAWAFDLPDFDEEQLDVHLKRLKENLKGFELHVNHDSVMKRMDSLMEKRMVIIEKHLKEREDFLENHLKPKMDNLDSLLHLRIPKISEEDYDDMKVIHMQQQHKGNKTRLIIIDEKASRKEKLNNKTISISIDDAGEKYNDILGDYIDHPGTALKIKHMMIIPAKDKKSTHISFELERADKLQFYLLDESGKKLYSEKLRRFDGSFDKKLDLYLENGTYFMVVNQKDASIAKVFKISEGHMHINCD